MFRDQKMQISETVYGNDRFVETLLRYHGKKFEGPNREEYRDQRGQSN